MCFALTDRSLTLETACNLFGLPFAKANVAYGVITPELLDYARIDVTQTAQLFVHAQAELDRHIGVDLRPERLYSPATVGTAYERAWGLQPPLEKFTDLDPAILGRAMASFYGGRAEARIVRTPVPVVVLDATSMYSLQNALLDTWPLLCAERLEVRDVTATVRQLVSDPQLHDRLFDPTVWSQEIGVTLVELDHPDGIPLPVRARWDPNAQSFGIGHNPLHYDGTVWYQLPDVLAAALRGGPAAIRVLRAVRLIPHGVQDGLTAVPLRGQIAVDPGGDNPFLTMINERHRIKHDKTIDEVERKRQDRFLKVTASATSYGILARYDRRSLTKPATVTVHGPDGRPFPAATSQPEDPGPFCCPPVAGAITAGARLMLALIETCVTEVGGAYAFMDTDSIAIIATPDGGPVPCVTATGSTVMALSFDEVRDIARRFEPLNLYADHVQTGELGRSIWKTEHDSLTRPLWCYVIATKRYILYRQRGKQLIVVDETLDDDPLELEDWSEHGLGLYLDPLPTGQQRDENDRRVWTRQAADYLLRRALGLPAERPAWAGLPALTQFRISSPHHATWFRLDPDSASDPQRPRPGGFGLLAHPDPMAPSRTGGLPAAPYTSDSRDWLTQPWYDRRTGAPISITTAEPGTEEFDDAIAAGAGRVRTLGDILDTWSRRPEHKSLAPDGTATGPRTSGQLQPRPVRSGPPITALIGKEGHRLAERASGDITDTDVIGYTAPSNDEWASLVRPILQNIGVEQVAEATGISPRRVRDWINGKARPHAGGSGHYEAARRLATDHARRRITELGLTQSDDDSAVMYAYLNSCTSSG